MFRERIAEDEHEEGEGAERDSELFEFQKEDPENPRAWSSKKKVTNLAIIALMSVLSPLASSIFAPGIPQIADALKTSTTAVIACQTGFVIMLGIGPLLLAPLSETFGRRRLYLLCFGAFTLLQIPSALATGVGGLVALRTLTGFFGSVGVANGGGTISDMYDSSSRARILGWYLLGPLLGPCIGPILGGLILEHLSWPWLFWILLIISGTITLISAVFLRETYAPTILHARKTHLERKSASNSRNGNVKKYHYKNEDHRPLYQKICWSMKRPLKILFTQPIVLIMAAYQALIFSTTYSLYTQMPIIYGSGIPTKSSGYDFSAVQMGLTYLSPGLGFLAAVIFLVPKIDSIYQHLTAQNNGEPKPEYRLPIANIGSVFIPTSLFAFAWLVEFHVDWWITLVPLFFYGIGQVCVFNSTQNYYIDAFERYAASAIAAGALFRSLFGGVVPLFAGGLFELLGPGWGMSIFGFVALAIAPSPLFCYFGERVRKRFEVDLDY